MRVFLCVALLFLVMVVAGCAMPNAPVAAGFIIEQKGPVAGFDTSADSGKVGEAQAEGILIVGYGDASIKAAAAEGGITKIHHVDIEVMNFFGIYARYKTIVYGE